MSATDAARVSVLVNVDRETAFEVFVRDIDLWWRRGPKYRFVAPFQGEIRLEPREGGRLLHLPDGESKEPFVVGTVSRYDPPEHLAFTWTLPNFREGQVTAVEISFHEDEGRTRVLVAHRGWGAIPKKHPARHGLDSAAFVMMNGRWWADILRSAKSYIENKRG